MRYNGKFHEIAEMSQFFVSLLMNPFVMHMKATKAKVSNIRIYCRRLPHFLPGSLDKAELGEAFLLTLLNTTLFPDAALGIDLGLATDQVGIRRADKLGALDNLPEDKGKDGKGNGKVRRDEAANAKGLEDIKADKKQSKQSEDEGHRRGVGSKGRLVGQGVAVEALGLASAVPAKVDDEHHHVGSNECRCGKVNEPVKDVGGLVGRTEEGDAGQQRHRCDTVEGHTGLGAVQQKLGSLVVCTELVEDLLRKAK